MNRIIVPSVVIGLAVAGFLLCAGQASAATGFVSASGTSLSLDGRLFVPKGVNLMDHDSIWYSTLTVPTLSWTKASDFYNIKKAGFNSVRLAVKTDYFQETKPPYKFSVKGFAWLDKIIALAKKQNVKIILDMHMPTGGIQQDYQINDKNGLFWDDPWMKGRFVDVWREIAKRYKNETTIWAYDLMNEPATIDFQSYEKLMQNTANSIRAYDSNHPLMLQRGMYVKEDGSWDMKFPSVDDANIIHTLHFYQPTDFTLQGAPWIKTNSALVSYPIASSTVSGVKAWNKDVLAAEMSALVASTSTPVILTEFGTLFPRQLSGQPAWVSDVAKAAQELGYGWHYWHYAGPKCVNAFALRSKYGVCRPKTLSSLSGLTK
ncbi:MAG: cellulase family glycosylhydrolase [Patescibacteria group bacterium]|nr:cellulase family glycosylhydrolase [Patescibacteria group bacterium]